MKQQHRTPKRTQRSRSKATHHKRDAQRELASLPLLSSLTDIPAYAELAATPRQQAAFEECRSQLVKDGEGLASEFALGCVVRLDRGFPAVVSAEGVERAEFSALLTKGRENSRVAVGDWVCVRKPSGHDMQLIEAIMPRESDIARWRGKARGEKQTLAANVDLVLVAQALSERPLDCDRIVRSAVIARDCGAQVAVVLTKADRPSLEVVEQDVRLVREVLGSEVPLVVTSSKAEREAHELDGEVSPEAVDVPEQGSDPQFKKQGSRPHFKGVAPSLKQGSSPQFGTQSAAAANGALRALCQGLGVLWGTDGVRSLVAPGVVAIVLGESGAGKSTLLNALLRRDVLETASVRASDDAGRHTTVARRMVSLPGAGIIVDEPGLRSLPLVGHERGLAKVFPEVADAAQRCHFRDCTHTHEPGCAVMAGVEAGTILARRANAYIALAAEMRESAASLDPDVTL